MKRRNLSLFLSLVLLTSSALTASAESAASTSEKYRLVIDHLGCSSFKDHFWNLAYTDLEQAHLVSPVQFTSYSEIKNPELLSEMDELLVWLRKDVLTLAKVNTTEEALALLTSLEIGASDTVFKEYIQKLLQKRFAHIDKLIKKQKFYCPTQNENQFKSHAQTFSLPAVTVGARFTFMTAHQSCDSLQRAAMTASSPDALGITIVGEHSDGIGSKRQITNLSLLNQTHYYLKGRRAPAASCHNVHKNPLIYDYGGKPRASTQLDSELNLFSNAGSGTSVLGIDCSGFVYSSLASQGLKLKKEGRLKAVGVYGVNARMMSNPSRNGLTCLKQVQLTKNNSLRPGDIIAGTGHVVIVDSASQDPFGISWITSKSQCRAENISTHRFDFEVVQSSSDKNGLGINRMEAYEFLENHDKIKGAMISTAIKACKARFGESSIANLTEGAIVRHIGGSACQDRKVSLTKSECIQSCSIYR